MTTIVLAAANWEECGRYPVDIQLDPILPTQPDRQMPAPTDPTPGREE
jgi:hypothetical protein